MIYTYTLTPSLDYTVYLPGFSPGKLNRSEEVYYYPGGKGINVSRVLKRLGADSTAVGLAGGFTGDYLEQFLQDEGIRTALIRTDSITRINVKIKSDQETELNGPGPEITEQERRQLLDRAGRMERGDWLVLAGRIPDSAGADFAVELAGICRDSGIRLAVDTSGPVLKELADMKPELMKPNEHELGELFGAEIKTKEDALHYARLLVRQGVRHVIVSMGGEGALYVSDTMEAEAQAPEVKVVNTVGAGDSLVSGFIAALESGKGAEEAFKYGVAAGSATVSRSDLCRKEDVDTLAEQVTVTRLNGGKNR
ncbi:6-phosphofructokinase isozyme 2 [Bhargavaea cecembensis DSE10]|uniref:Tagatose-6-phosphate kinase n=1 Tax=Bhargavaea cecembensis DSE10 TaxID=1235279 RepID=M7N8G3_9BACL|nr:1-phosphofructokinase [Bhargavaea cecembensis]EMR04883.1 6-phosphofructokinase isozyme 2 [Bhargavaea cecembensis DSE10]